MNYINFVRLFRNLARSKLQNCGTNVNVHIFQLNLRQGSSLVDTNLALRLKVRLMVATDTEAAMGISMMHNNVCYCWFW